MARARAGQGLATPTEEGWLRWRVCDPGLGVSIDTIFSPNHPSHVNHIHCTHPLILGVRARVEHVAPLRDLQPQLHRRSSTPRHEAQSADLFRSNLSPFQLLYVTTRAYGRIAGHTARHNSQVRPLPNIFGSFGGFECMIAELSRLSASHAHHDRSRYVEEY